MEYISVEWREIAKIFFDGTPLKSNFSQYHEAD